MRLIGVNHLDDLPVNARNTPIEALFLYHNLGAPFQSYQSAELLVGMCMDNRKQLRIPENFAYILRTGGGNLRSSEFKVSYAIAIGGIRTIALIAHNECGMVNLMARRDRFVKGLVAVGWEQSMAEEHFNSYAPLFEIGNELDFVASEAKRLRQRYPQVSVFPLYYKLEDNLLYFIEE